MLKTRLQKFLFSDLYMLEFQPLYKSSKLFMTKVELAISPREKTYDKLRPAYSKSSWQAYEEATAGSPPLYAETRGYGQMLRVLFLSPETAYRKSGEEPSSTQETTDFNGSMGTGPLPQLQ